MPPTFAAARNTYSGRSVAKKFSVADWSRRSSSLRVLRSRLVKPALWRRRTIADPTKPRCPATKTLLLGFTGLTPCQTELVACVPKCLFLVREFQIVFHHDFDQLLEVDLRFPA